MVHANGYGFGWTGVYPAKARAGVLSAELDGGGWERSSPGHVHTISAAWLSSRADWELTEKIGMKYVPKMQGKRDINVVHETAHIVHGQT